jgi:hypothetical protein
VLLVECLDLNFVHLDLKIQILQTWGILGLKLLVFTVEASDLGTLVCVLKAELVKLRM